MSTEQAAASGPDLTEGIPIAEFGDGTLRAGHVGAEAVLLARCGEEFFAIGATCSHYNAPLVDGVVVGQTVRCPWHHACFSLRTGEAVRAPALSPVSTWQVEQVDGRVCVRHQRQAPAPLRASAGQANTPPRRIVIVGGGAAGFAGAQMLRREQFDGSIVMLSEEDAPPVDRPNLSKDYLAGSAPEDWLALRPASFYADNAIELRTGVRAQRIDPAAGTVTLADGQALTFDRLLLATGAEPNRIAFPGSQLPHVHTLRSLADCRAIIDRTASARRAVVLGASFIGLEAAAALRTRGLAVDVVATDARPMERILGRPIADLVRALHESKGVVFHLEDSIVAIDGERVALKSGATLQADLVVMGVGVRPRTALAEQAGLKLDRGVSVDEFLQTSAPGVFAAGDIARWPDPYSGERLRVEHWVLAQRQGQTAARNMLGQRQSFDAVPFFWSAHYDVSINYVGHAEAWDELEVEGDIAARDGLVRYRRQGRVRAVATVFRDVDSLRAEIAMEQAIAGDRKNGVRRNTGTASP